MDLFMRHEQAVGMKFPKRISVFSAKSRGSCQAALKQFQKRSLAMYLVTGKPQLTIKRPVPVLGIS